MKIIKTLAEAKETIGIAEKPTNWLKIEQSQIDLFADVTRDHQFIHVDPDKAKYTPFKSTIAHGFLSLSLISHFAKEFGFSFLNAVMAFNYGLDKVRFISPVKSGSEIRAVATVMDITEKSPNQYLAKYEIVVEIKGEEKPALIAQWLVLQVTN